MKAKCSVGDSDKKDGRIWRRMFERFYCQPIGYSSMMVRLITLGNKNELSFVTRRVGLDLSKCVTHANDPEDRFCGGEGAFLSFFFQSKSPKNYVQHTILT